MPAKGSKLTEQQKERIRIGTIKGIGVHKITKICTMCNKDFTTIAKNKIYCGNLKLKTGCAYIREVYCVVVVIKV